MADTLDDVIADLQSYVVAPLNAFGLGGFVFDVEGESQAHLAADITDHYTEENKALQDHIAIKPKKITLKGYVGELVYSAGGNGATILQQAVQKLTVISSFLPTLSAAATQLRQTIASPTNSDITLSSAADIFGLVQDAIGTFGDNANQAKGYAYFKALMNQGILMGVQTPWEFMTNMAIETITAIQPENTKYFSDFAVTLKQIRIAQTISTAYTNLSPQNQVATDVNQELSGAQQYQGVAAVQAPNPVPIGNVPGVSLPSSSLPGWQSQLGNVNDITSNPGAMSILQNAVTPAH